MAAAKRGTGRLSNAEQGFDRANAPRIVPGLRVMKIDEETLDGLDLLRRIPAALAVEQRATTDRGMSGSTGLIVPKISHCITRS